MSLIINTTWTANKQVYAIILNTEGEAWNVSDNVFESNYCLSTGNYAIQLDADDCIPGLYKGTAEITIAGTFLLIALEETGSGPDLSSDEIIGSQEIDYDGESELTHTDIKTVVDTILASLGLSEDGTTTVNLSRLERMIRVMYQRKTNNRSRN